jgi:hypothetical protein
VLAIYPFIAFLGKNRPFGGLSVKLALLASMVAGGARLLPNVSGWTQTPDVRTEAIVTATILLGIASLLRRNKVSREELEDVSASPLRDAA